MIVISTITGIAETQMIAMVVIAVVSCTSELVRVVMELVSTKDNASVQELIQSWFFVAKSYRAACCLPIAADCFEKNFRGAMNTREIVIVKQPWPNMEHFMLASLLAMPKTV